MTGFSLLTASFVLVGIGVYQCGGPVDETAERAASTDADVRGAIDSVDVGTTTDGADREQNGSVSELPSRAWPLEPFESLARPPNRSGPRIQFVDLMNRGRAVSVTVGAPGLWPPVHLDSDDEGEVRLPQPNVTTLRGDEIGRYEVLARHQQPALAYWDEVRPAEQRDYQLRPAGPLRIRVVGPRAESVSDVTVSLGRGAIGFVGLTKQTGADGIATFAAIPSGEYRVQVRKGDRRGRASIRHTVDRGEADDPVWVTLRAAGEARAALPDPSQVGSFGEGSGEAASTGGASNSTAESVSTTFRLSVTGLSESAWRQSDFEWRVTTPERVEPEWRPGRLQKTDAEAYAWASELEGVSIEVRLSNGAQRATETFRLEAGSTDATWQVQFSRRMEVYVVDGSGAPVRGAKMFVWRGNELTRTMLSGGNRPRHVTVESETGAESSDRLRIAAMRGGIGEAYTEVSSEDDQVTLELSDAIYTHQWTGRITDMASLEETLEAELVSIEGGIQLDPLPGGWAAQHGIASGTWLLSAQRVDGAVVLHLSRSGRHRTVSLPASSVTR